MSLVQADEYASRVLPAIHNLASGNYSLANLNDMLRFFRGSGTYVTHVSGNPQETYTLPHRTPSIGLESDEMQYHFAPSDTFYPCTYREPRRLTLDELISENHSQDIGALFVEAIQVTTFSDLTLPSKPHRHTFKVQRNG